MESQILWLVGVMVSVGIALITALIGTFRHFGTRLNAVQLKTGEELKTTRADLDKRIDDVKEKYVRRDDLDSHITRLDGSIRDLRDENRENHRQVLELLSRSKT